jgi:phosphoribosyl-ATP pyrophosphohydrolase
VSDRPLDALARLMDVIEARRESPREGSYTTSLLAGGIEGVGAKVLEEARELVEAAGEAGEAGRRHAVREAADLVYHVFVMLALRGISLAELAAELDRRAGTSGLEEKAARGETAS